MQMTAQYGYQAGTIVHITEKIQKYLNLLICWFEEWGFRLSPVKTVPVFFTKSWNAALPPDIELNGNVLMYEKSHRFLGVIFDKSLTWQPHIENVITRSKRKLNILRCLTGTNWGSSSKSLIMVYRALIRSLFDTDVRRMTVQLLPPKKPFRLWADS